MDFLSLPYKESGGIGSATELVIDCIFCGKENHLYVNKVEGTFMCHRCGKSGGIKKFERELLEAVVNFSASNENQYWSTRGFKPETIQQARLGYWAPLARHTIPYMGPEGTINVSFRASKESQEPKYIRLPGFKSQPYVIGDKGSKVVIITEGEIDAISVWQSDPNLLALGIPGSTHVNDGLLGAIPANATVIASMDSDIAGRNAAKKIRERIPSVLFVQLPKGIKDLNQLLVEQGEETVRAVIDQARNHAPDDDQRRGGLPSSQYVNLPDETGDWLIQDLWMEQAIGFLAGIPKAYKSTLALHMGYHVSMGKPFLGKKIVQKGPVLLFQEEDNDHIIKTRLRNINGGLGSDSLYICTPGITGRHVRLDSDDSLQFIDEEITRVEPVLVILDPLANMHSLEDENNAAGTNKLLEKIRYLRDLRKCSFMIVHHLKKGGDGDASGQKMRGSSVFHAKSETAIYLEKYGDLLRMNIESKIAPGRTIETRYDGRDFSLEDEWGRSVADEGSVLSHSI